MSAILTTILGPIIGIVDKFVPDKTEASRLKAEIEKAIIANEAKVQETLKEIAVAEIGGDWFQRSWRPLLSYSVIAMMLYQAIFKGWAEAIFGVVLSGISPDDLFMFCSIWASVYGLGRTFEKTGSKVEFSRK